MDIHYTITSFPKFPFDKTAHMQKWAHLFFSEKLRQMGFINYPNNELSWYKVINGEVLLTVYLYAFSPLVPLVPAIGYGMHPLFIEAPLPQKTTVRGWTNNEVMSAEHLNYPSTQLDAETFVMCPNTPRGGAEKLDEVIFPIFSSIHSVGDVYSFYKKRYLKKAQSIMDENQGKLNNVVATNDFIDMAIFMDDTEMYAICMNDLELKKDWNKKEMPRMDAQRAAIEWGKRDAYLEVLEARKKKFINKLERKLGIKI